MDTNYADHVYWKHWANPDAAQPANGEIEQVDRRYWMVLQSLLEAEEAPPSWVSRCYSAFDKEIGTSSEPSLVPLRLRPEDKAKFDELIVKMRNDGTIPEVPILPNTANADPERHLKSIYDDVDERCHCLTFWMLGTGSPSIENRLNRVSRVIHESAEQRAMEQDEDATLDLLARIAAHSKSKDDDDPDSTEDDGNTKSGEDEEEEKDE